mgnify:CR=1 FL=1
MAFEYPSEKTKRKKQAKQQAEAAEAAMIKTLNSASNKKEGSKKELAMEQIQNAISSENVGDGKKITKKGLKKIVDAATDDKQLTRTQRSMSRHGVSPLKFKSGGRTGYKDGSKCKIAKKGKGRAYGQNS